MSVLCHPQVGCKAAVTFFQYCVLANFFWLLVEGLFLQTLLIFSFANKRTFFWWYTFIGWGEVWMNVLVFSRPFFFMCVNLHVNCHDKCKRV